MNNENQILIEKIEQLFNTKLDNINYKLDSIHEQTSKTNGRVNKLENDVRLIQMNDLKHNYNCPQLKKIEVMQEEIDKQKTIKAWLIKAISIAGGVLGLILTLDKLFDIFGRN